MSDAASEDLSSSADSRPATVSTTLREWLATRRPDAPQALTDRLARVLGSSAMDGVVSSGVLLERGISTLRSALSDRDGALDLLAADALITYAMEAAADDCASMEATAEDAIQRISRGAV